MAKKIAFVNGKGGCGKSMSVFHVAGVLSKAGEKVLVIDLDKQRNTSDTFLMNTVFPEATVLDVMNGKVSPDKATARALFQKRGNALPRYYNVDCMVGDYELEEESNLRAVDKEIFKEELDFFIEMQGYDWVIVDMPPSSKLINDISFACIVDYIIVPFSSDTHSVKGYSDIMNTVERARELNPSLNIIGVYLSRYMAKCKVDIFIKESLEDYETFIDTQIPLASDLREAVMFGRPISFYKEFSGSRKAFESLVSEMRKRIELSNN